MAKKMFPLIAVAGVAAVALMHSKKKKKGSGGAGGAGEEGLEDDLLPGPPEDQMLTLEQHCASMGGELMVIKSSDGSPSKVCSVDGKLYVMPIDNLGNIAEMSAPGHLEEYPQSLNAGLWNGATAAQFGNFGWPADIVDGHREVVAFVVGKLNHSDIEAFQMAWNEKHNDNIRTDGVLDLKTLEAINKSK